MKAILALLSLALLASTGLAQQKFIAEYAWPDLVKSGKLKVGTVETLPDQTVVLKIENSKSEPLMVNLLTIEKPAIEANFYSIAGNVRYEGVEGDGFLEMWNHFGESAYFSRTMGETGPMAKLKGTSDWRPFILPFTSSPPVTTPPTKLVINLHLPGKGTVYLKSPLKLSEAAKGSSTAPGAWWSDRTGNIAAASFGTAVGCLGGLIGWLSSRGTARSFVLGTAWVMTGIGLAATATGLIAAASHQPNRVWYPLLLTGVISVLVFPFCLRNCMQRYRELELRRMASMDAA
jgi:hypothetical protein